jgi:phosphoenolpyruvate carboxylase
MYQEWPWFRKLIELIGMNVSRTAFSISKNYDDQLVENTAGDELMKVGEEVRHCSAW